MAILRPQRFFAQPQYAAPIDYAGLGKGVRILFNPAAGPIDLATRRIWTPNGHANVMATPRGKVFSFDGVDDYYSHTGYPELTSNVGTFFIWCPRVGVADTNGHVFFGASSPVVAGHQVYPTRMVGIGSNSGSSGTLASWFNTTNRSLILASGGTAVTCKAFLDGDDSGLTWSDAPKAWGSGNKNFNLGRYVGGSSWDFDGSILVAGLTDAVWGTAEAKAFHENPWQLFKAPARRLWGVTDSGTNITGAGQITGAEALGSATLSADVAAAGVTNAEAFGNAAVTVRVTAAGIAAAEALGAPGIGADVTGSSIASVEEFGSTVLLAIIDTTGITSAEAFGTPEVGGPASAEITGAGQISTAEAIASPAIGVSIAATGVASGEALGGLSLSTEIVSAGIVTAEALGAPTVIELAPAEIVSVGIASAEALGMPAVTEAGPAEITAAGGIASAEAFGGVSVFPPVPYTGTAFQAGSGYRRPRARRIEPVAVVYPHRIGAAGIESQERFGYPMLKWQGRSRKVRDEEFLLSRAA